MKDNTAFVVVVAILAGALAFLTWSSGHASDHSVLDANLTQQSQPLTSPNGAAASARCDRDGRVGVQSSSAGTSPVVRKPLTDPDPSSPVGEVPLFHPGYEPTEAAMPTVDGLYALTVARFTDEDFLKMTPKRARELLPVDDDLPDASMPGNLIDALGTGFPTREDCERGFQFGYVQELLTHAQTMSLALVPLEMVPVERRSPEFSKTIESIERAREAVMLTLMKELDRSTGYKSWSLLYRLWSEWSK